MVLTDRRGGSIVRWLLVVVAATVLTVALTAASVSLITPDVFVDECERVQLVPPVECAGPAASATD